MPIASRGSMFFQVLVFCTVIGVAASREGVFCAFIIFSFYIFFFPLVAAPGEHACHILR